MSDLIDRQAAIDAVKAMEDTSGKGEIAGFYNMILEHVIDKLIALSSAQPKPCNDAISRADALDVLAEFQESVENGTPCYANARVEMKALPSVQPERTCVNCGRTINNGGWYADGGTRCPIEEHYALPKDGYCHLWEKRNVTDDDYPERRTDD